MAYAHLRNKRLTVHPTPSVRFQFEIFPGRSEIIGEINPSSTALCRNMFYSKPQVSTPPPKKNRSNVLKGIGFRFRFEVENENYHRVERLDQTIDTVQ